jgi:hypothetical protein
MSSVGGAPLMILKQYIEQQNRPKPLQEGALGAYFGKLAMEFKSGNMIEIHRNLSLSSFR